MTYLIKIYLVENQNGKLIDYKTEGQIIESGKVEVIEQRGDISLVSAAIDTKQLQLSVQIQPVTGRWKFDIVSQTLILKHIVFRFRSGNIFTFLQALFEQYRSSKGQKFNIADICEAAGIGDSSDRVKQITRDLRKLRYKAQELHCELPFTLGPHQILINQNKFKA